MRKLNDDIQVTETALSISGESLRANVRAHTTKKSREHGVRKFIDLAPHLSNFELLDDGFKFMKKFLEAFAGVQANMI